MEAALSRVAAGGHPIVEIMIRSPSPARRWPSPVVGRAAIAEAEAAGGAASRRGRTGKDSTGALEVLIGTMIETPRAALLAAEIAEEADFFSFGPTTSPDDFGSAVTTSRAA